MINHVSLTNLISKYIAGYDFEKKYPKTTQNWLLEPDLGMGKRLAIPDAYYPDCFLLIQEPSIYFYTSDVNLHFSYRSALRWKDAHNSLKNICAPLEVPYKLLNLNPLDYGPIIRVGQKWFQPRLKASYKVIYSEKDSIVLQSFKFKKNLITKDYELRKFYVMVEDAPLNDIITYESFQFQDLKNLNGLMENKNRLSASSIIKTLMD